MEIKEITVIKVSRLKEAKAGETPFEVKIKITQEDTCGDEPVTLDKELVVKSFSDLKIGPQIVYIRSYDFTNKTGKHIFGFKILKPFEVEKWGNNEDI